MNGEMDLEKKLVIDKLQNIKSNIDEINKIHHSLMDELYDGFLIDRKIIYEEQFETIYNNNVYMENEMIDDLINKINDMN